MALDLLHANDRAGEYPGSHYAATRAAFDRLPPLQGAETADVCIIGAGYTGLSAALHLAEKGLSVIVLEAHRVGFGASGRNGGQVGSGQRQEQPWIERSMGRETARRLWNLSEDAKALVRDLVIRHDMPVTYHPGIIQACRTQSEVRETHRLAEMLARDYAYPEIEPLDEGGIRRLVGSARYVGGSIDRGAGHLHPLNLAIGIAWAAIRAGARIFEGSEVTAITPGPRPLARTAAGEVRASHLVLAANGYLGRLSPRVAARVMPINNFMVATEPLGERAREVLAEPVAVADTDFMVNYWRLSEDGRLLFGGGESYGYRFPDIIRTVRKPMLRIYPQLRDTRIDHAWGGTLAITVNRMPCFCRPAQNTLSASGYSGHGVALATLAGRLVAEAVAGDAAGFDLMAAIPSPRFPGGATLRWPLLVLAMTWFSMRDRLGW